MRKLLVIALILIALVSCAKQGPLGSKNNPIKMYFVPSMEADKVVTSAEEIAQMLHVETGYHFKVAVPVSYAAVVEAMGTQEADIAFLATEQNVSINQFLTTLVEKNMYSNQIDTCIAKLQNEVNNLSDEVEVVKNVNTLLSTYITNIYQGDLGFYSNRMEDIKTDISTYYDPFSSLDDKQLRA